MAKMNCENNSEMEETIFYVYKLHFDFPENIYRILASDIHKHIFLFTSANTKQEQAQHWWGTRGLGLGLISGLILAWTQLSPC